MIVRIFTPDFIPLPIYPITFSSHQLQENINRPLGARDIAQVILVLEGKGILTYNGERHSLEQGCAFFVDQQIPHRYESDGSLVTAWMGFHGTGMDTLRDYVGKKPFLLVKNANVKRLVSIIEKMEHEYFWKQRDGILSALAYTLVIEFFESNSDCEPTEIENVLRYMEENLSQKLTLGQLADVCHISKSSFCKKFKDSFGCTAFEKLLELRLLHALSLLSLYPDEKIHSIAKKCGFDDVGYFCKAFKKRFGTTPAVSRNLSMIAK